jgi:RNA polymerase sigma factor (sigma-70 family)
MSTVEFNNLISKNANFLHGFALKFTRDWEEANDLLQDTLLKALRYKDNFQEGTNIRGWLYTIMRNIFINNYKRKAFQNTFIDKTDESFFINSSQDYGFDSISSQINQKDIFAAINSLTDDYRVPFTMFTEGYHYEEIAEHVGIPIGTVKSRIYHARQKLMLQLKDFRRSNDRRAVSAA